MVTSGSEYSKNYEDYIQTIYKPSSNKQLISSALWHFSDEQEPADVSATAQLKAAENFQSLVTPDSHTRLISKNSTPAAPRRYDHQSKFPVYATKKSAEYRAVLRRRCLPTRNDKGFDFKITNEPRNNNATTTMGDESKRNTSSAARATNMLIDYKTFDTNNKPISEFLYPSYNYVKSNDSRIFGSNFMMVSLRQPDAWFSRVDKLLQEARNS